MVARRTARYKDDKLHSVCMSKKTVLLDCLNMVIRSK